MVNARTFSTKFLIGKHHPSHNISGSVKTNKMIRFIRYILFGALIHTSYPLRIADRDPDNVQQKNIADVATNIIASSILKNNAESNQNFVFSPLGYSSILTILSEGARGDTSTDIASFLRYPDIKSRVRSTYQEVLKNFQGNNPTQAPQFRTWLYVYKNNTINDDFKEIISKEYFVDVKEVERDVYVENDLPKSRQAADEATTPNADSAASANSTNSKDIPDFETLKKTELEDETRLIDDQKDASKFDAVVEDRQYVEVPIIKKQEDKEAQQDDAKDVPETIAELTKELKGQRQNDKMRSKLENINEMEIMDAQETVFSMRKFGIAKSDDDGTSVLSGNSLIGEARESKQETKMLLFNGLYYKGSWATPFQQLRYGPESVFYLSESEKISAKMMRSRGYYKIAELPNLKCQAIELPYENDRYALLVLLPNSRNGLKSVLAEFNTNTIPDVLSQLEEESVDISIPKFGFDSTSGAEKSLTKCGLASIFTSKADFGGISNDQKLHVGELQQHVSIRVDEGSSSENFLTATNALRSNAQPERAIAIDRPFLFFVRDVIDDIIIVAGKLTMPPHQDEPIFSIDP